MPQKTTDQVNTDFPLIERFHGKSVTGYMHAQRKGETEPPAYSVERHPDGVVPTVRHARKFLIVRKVEPVRQKVEDESASRPFVLPAPENLQGRVGQGNRNQGLGLDRQLLQARLRKIHVRPLQRYDVGNAKAAGVEGEEKQVQDPSAAWTRNFIITFQQLANLCVGQMAHRLTLFGRQPAGFRTVPPFPARKVCLFELCVRWTRQESLFYGLPDANHEGDQLPVDGGRTVPFPYAIQLVLLQKK